MSRCWHRPTGPTNRRTRWPTRRTQARARRRDPGPEDQLRHARQAQRREGQRDPVPARFRRQPSPDRPPYRPRQGARHRQVLHHLPGQARRHANRLRALDQPEQQRAEDEVPAVQPARHGQGAAPAGHAALGIPASARRDRHLVGRRTTGAVRGELPGVHGRHRPARRGRVLSEHGALPRAVR